MELSVFANELFIYVYMYVYSPCMILEEKYKTFFPVKSS